MTATNDIDYKNFKAGYVALIGKPNVGKSTLMNALLGMKLSIVTAKPQTTRQQVLGILNQKYYQIIFLDTPGLLEPRYKLQDKMIKTAHRAMNEADIVMLMIEPKKRIDPITDDILNQMKNQKKPVLLVINKIDTVEKSTLLPIIERYSQKYQRDEILPISALNNDGLDELKTVLINLLPKGMPFYPPDMITDQPERFFVAEIIREKVFQNYGEEIPYSTTVLVEEFKEREGTKDYIRANIIVEKDSQKGIIIGKKGAAIKKVGQFAREEIELFLGRSIYLELYVKVRENWRQKEHFLKEFGYR